MGCNFSRSVGSNNSTPPFSGGATTPFTGASSFDDGFMRIRFPEAGGDPTAGQVELIEYYMPLEFDFNGCGGVTVTTNVDHSVGMLGMTGNPPTIPVSPSLNRPCTSWASGDVSGTSLTWQTCDVIPNGTNGWNHASAQGNGVNEEGCFTRMSVWGAVECSGFACGFVPGLGNQRNTWEQLMSNATFSGTNYRTASFSLPEVEIPESTSNTETRTFLTISSATPVHVECGLETAMTCNED